MLRTHKTTVANIDALQRSIRNRLANIPVEEKAGYQHLAKRCEWAHDYKHLEHNLFKDCTTCLKDLSSQANDATVSNIASLQLNSPQQWQLRTSDYVEYYYTEIQLKKPIEYNNTTIKTLHVYENGHVVGIEAVQSRPREVQFGTIETLTKDTRNTELAKAVAKTANITEQEAQTKVLAYALTNHSVSQTKSSTGINKAQADTAAVSNKVVAKTTSTKDVSTTSVATHGAETVAEAPAPALQVENQQLQEWHKLAIANYLGQFPEGFSTHFDQFSKSLSSQPANGQTELQKFHDYALGEYCEGDESWLSTYEYIEHLLKAEKTKK